MRSATTARRWALPLAEAGAAMLLASLAIRLLPFATIARSAIGRRRSARPAGAAEIERVRRAVLAWARRLPWRTLCFEQGLAAHWMLRRRALTSTLHYGAATSGGELKAHVWVRSGASDVIGCENAGDYALLATYPPAPPPFIAG